jgi:DNA invertase Pin-like site-specific DNA recombinase
VVHVLIDNDTSASSGKRRKAYEELLTWVGDGKVDIVIAWHNDRLHRRPDELERYIDVCQPAAVATHFAQAGPIDLTTASGRMVARQLGVMARSPRKQRRCCGSPAPSSPAKLSARSCGT